jgi:hypothetical protein
MTDRAIGSITNHKSHAQFDSHAGKQYSVVVVHACGLVLRVISGLCYCNVFPYCLLVILNQLEMDSITCENFNLPLCYV